MKILALDTSGTNCSVSIIDEDKVIADFNLNTGLTHSQTLMPLIDSMCKFSEIDLKDIDVFACSIGPGSFTGLRIGIATIKGFALSLNKKVIAVGIPEEQLRKAAASAVCKINIDSDSRLAFTAAVRKVFWEKPGEFDPRKYCGPARDLMTELYKHKIINVLGSNGKAE